MHHESTPLLRCEKCGLHGADGVDEHGYPLCLGCSHQRRGERIAHRETFRALLGLSLTLALAGGMPEADIRQSVAEELEGMLGYGGSSPADVDPFDLGNDGSEA
jgi:hypothetical protein